MSDIQADMNVQDTTADSPSSFMLPPNSIETVLLLPGVSLAFTTFLHGLAITNILGILIFIAVANLLNLVFGQFSAGLIATVQCRRHTSEACQKAVEARIVNSGQELLTWISGVPAGDKVLDADGSLNHAAGQQFLSRAGIVGAVASFALIYITINAIYSAAYKRGLVSTSVPELDAVAAKSLAAEELQETTDKVQFRSSNPLLSPGDDAVLSHKSSASAWIRNPLMGPEIAEDVQDACCTGCEALETAQTEWIEKIRQFEDTNDAVVEENEILKGAIFKLRSETAELRKEVKLREDRLEYLEVLLDEAARKLGQGEYVRDILWEAYLRRKEAAEAADEVEEVVEHITHHEPHAV